MSPAEAEPLSVSQVLLRAVRLYQNHLLPFLAMASLPTLWWVVCGMVILHLVSRGGPNPDLRAVWALMSVPEKLLVVSSFFLTLFIVVRTCAASVLLAGSAQSGWPARFGHALLHTPRGGRRLFWLLLLPTIPFGPAGLFFVPFLGIFLLPAAPVAIMENRKVSESLHRSGELFKGYWGRVVLFFVGFFALASAALLGLFALTSIARQAFGPGLPVILGFALGFGLFFIVVQLCLIVLTVHYYDMRLRKEGPAVPEASV